MAHNYLEVNKKKIEALCKGELILIVTATDTETENTHKILKPFPEEKKILKFHDNNITYYFGVLGKYKVAQVQCSMGSISRTSSISTVLSSLSLLKSKVVLMVGIAFGVDDLKQKIGDVLISESIIPYNNKRIGVTETINRGTEIPASSVLLSRFKSAKLQWEFQNNDGEKLNIIFTRLLSGEELIDNKEYRNSLTNIFPECQGGEMEGAGIASACDGKADWILVKGICDFADGNKHHDKKQRQTLAIKSALSIVLEVLNSEYSFEHFGLLPILENQKIEDNSIKTSAYLNDVLFDVYDKSYEKYYIKREFDNNFNDQISQFGIWIYGPSGCGKSNLIVRNLEYNSSNYITINLANYIGEPVEKYFEEIYYELKSYLKKENYEQYPENFQDGVKKIINLFKTNFLNKELIIFIEEIPIGCDNENFKLFSQKLFSLLNSKNLVKGLEKIKFVLSSINNPVKNIEGSQQKIHQQFKFIELNYWEIPSLNFLISMIEESLNFSVSQGVKEKLILASKGSPRFIKKYFRNVFAVNRFDEATLYILIEETKNELLNG
ncbi:hypothetical protein [Flavobacterium sp.]|uniref:hypothetical protein n=1 Tax=Flavobacterium sp. TaxID=239 RepID=UPI00261B8695|nr:hypothetical protein [Flavobacterium sp.]